MRWAIYLEQTQALGTVALFACAISLGVFSWWYVIQRSKWLARWRGQLNTGFWTLIVLGYLYFMYRLCFTWPG